MEQEIVDIKTLGFENYRAIKPNPEPVIFTGNPVLDEWWSSDGGIVIGTSIFLTGTSGSGKSTFSVEMARILENHKTLIYSREMHRSDVKQQTQRLNVHHDNVLVADFETCPRFEDFVKILDEAKPKFIIIDSLQVVSLEDYPDENQENAQYNIIKTLREWIKKNNAVLFVIGHNKKDGEFRGANTIMQMFDAHIEMIHDKDTDIRTMAWGQKNRKGPLKSLTYEFTSNSIEFYKAKEQTLEERMQKILDELTSKCKKERKHENYNTFKNSVDVECEGKTYVAEIEKICFLISCVQKNYEKYLK